LRLAGQQDGGASIGHVKLPVCATRDVGKDIGKACSGEQTPEHVTG